MHRSCNATKTNQTAYDYISNKGEEELSLYLARVDEWFKQGILSYGKMQRLKVSFKEYSERKKINKETEADKKLWENFIDRQLKETQYIARKSKEILQQICNNITTTEGSVTAKLRTLWGWDEALMNLQRPKYQALGQTIIKEWASDHGKNKHQREEIKNWSKRDDHRHHAIDALVIACTHQGFIQRINTLSSSDTKDEMVKEIESAKVKFGKNYNEEILDIANSSVKNYREKTSKLDTYLRLQRPSVFSTSYIEQEAAKILVSFKAGKKVSTNGVRKIKVNGKQQIIQSNIIVPRGPLHEQFVYGKIKTVAKNLKTNTYIKFPIKYLFENSDLIVDQKIKKLIEERLTDNLNNISNALKSLKSSPIYLNIRKTQLLETAHCFKDEFVIKYKLSDFKKDDVKYIVDEKVRQLVKARFDEHDNEKEAFKDILWFNESKRIPILTIRCFTGLSAVEAIRKDENKKEIGFAKTGNNHHIAIYKDNSGNAHEHICTFWHAVERKKHKIPYIIDNTNMIWGDLLDKELPQSFLNKLPPENLELQLSLQQNEMFILGLLTEEFEDAHKQNNKALLSEHLYLVWSISDSDYWFRHHLETKNSELKNIVEAKESKRYYRFKSVGALNKLNPVKVRLNHLGEITKIG